MSYHTFNFAEENTTMTATVSTMALAELAEKASVATQISPSTRTFRSVSSSEKSAYRCAVIHSGFVLNLAQRTR